MVTMKLDALLLLLIQVVLVVLFAVFGVYDEKYEAESYPMFQDVHVMIFVGFGFLMTFLRRYGYSAVGFNFLLAALIIQWAMLCQGFYRFDEHHKIKLGIESLYKADIAAAAVLISMGAVLGRTTYMQLVVMGVVEIAIFSANAFLGSDVFQVADAGGSIFVHAFGAYFGLAVSYVIGRKDKQQDNGLEEARYTSDLFAMIGTVFLWIFWPSFNAIEATGDGQHRALLNTYISLASCCVASFAASLFFSHEGKFDMVHVQNSTLAGGVAVGTAANLLLQPWGAATVGAVAGVLSVAGYAKVTPWLRKSLHLKDTCGVHNLHGMPAVLAGVVGALMAGLATRSAYGDALFEIYPARAPPGGNGTHEVVQGIDRTAAEQAAYQIIALVVTVLVALVTGVLTGLILKLLKTLPPENLYDDNLFWTLPEPAESIKKETATYDNPSFEPTIKDNAFT